MNNVIPIPFSPPGSARKNPPHIANLIKSLSPAEVEENKAFCHICLRGGILTKEHIPPQSAFNNEQRLWDRLVLTQGDKATTCKSKVRGGFWVDTLCKSCNEDVCSLYAHAYVRFVKNLVSKPRLLDHDGRRRILSVQADTLLLAKEIATMILAVEPLNVSRAHPLLRQFVLNSQMVLDPGFRVYAFIVPDDRRAGTIVRGHSRADLSYVGLNFTGGEVSMYPFGFVYAWKAESGYALDELADVTDWFTTSDPEFRQNYVLKTEVRLTGVDSIQSTLGYDRNGPQLDYLRHGF